MMVGEVIRGWRRDKRGRGITDAAVDIVAEAIYNTMPETHGGESVDGFQVSSGGAYTWHQLLECGERYAEPYRQAARAAMTAMREMED